MNDYLWLKYIKKALLSISIFLGIFIIFLFFSAHKTDSDEGIILSTAWRIWNGSKDLYSTNFVDYLAPGSALSVYWIWKLFGQPYFAYAKLLVLFFWLCGSLGIYLIISKYTSKITLLFLAILLWTISIGYSSQINHNPLSTAISVWALYLILLLQKAPKHPIGPSLLLGFVNALVLWFLQTKGLAIFTVFFFYFFLNKNIFKKALIFYSSSFISFSLFFLSITGLKRTLNALFLLPLSLNYISVNQSQPYFPCILAALTLIFLMFIVSIKTKRKDLFIICLFQCSLFISTVNNFNFVHFLMNIFPAMIFFVVCFSENYSRLQPVLGRVINVLTVCLFIFITNISIRNILGPNIFKDNSLKEFSAPQITRAKNIYAGPFLAGYYYEARKTTFYPLSHTDVINPKLESVMLDQIKLNQPEIIFLNTNALSKKLNISADNPIDAYVRNDYIKCLTNFKKGVDVYVLDQSFCPK